jgi:hypothetical protein
MTSSKLLPKMQQEEIGYVSQAESWLSRYVMFDYCSIILVINLLFIMKVSAKKRKEYLLLLSYAASWIT